MFREQGSPHGMAWALAGMAAAVLEDGRPALAARLLGAAETAREQAEQPSSTSDRTELAAITAAVRDAEPDFAALFAAGRTLAATDARSLVEGDRASA